MKPDAKRGIYQTKVWTIPSYELELRLTLGQRDRSSLNDGSCVESCRSQQTELEHAREAPPMTRRCPRHQGVVLLDGLNLSGRDAAMDLRHGALVQQRRHVGSHDGDRLAVFHHVTGIELYSKNAACHTSRALRREGGSDSSIIYGDPAEIAHAGHRTQRRSQPVRQNVRGQSMRRLSSRPRL